MLHYILQVVTFQLLFLIIYDVFLRKETFFNLNRVYLLGTALLSVVIPFIKIEQIKTVVAKDFVIRLPEVIIGETTTVASGIDPQIAMEAGINIEPEPTSIWNIILISGMCLAALILVIKVSKLLWLASKHPKRWSGNFLIINLLNSTKAFSFFHYIFLGEKLNIQERSSILEHEIVHVKQRHTLDLLLFEVFRIIFWFNPLVYMYQKRIAALHEYIADANAVKLHNKADYYDNLLSQVFETQQFSFVNPFFKHSLIKKRIIMLSKSKSKRINIIKYALLIPIVFSMLIYTSSYAQEKTVTTEAEHVVDQELSDEDLYNKYYEDFVNLYSSKAITNEDLDTYILGNENYIKSRDEFIKSKAFGTYLKDLRVAKENEKTSSKTPFSETLDPITYEAYLQYKKTDEARLEWESRPKDGILRLVVTEAGNMTPEEKTKFDEKVALIESEELYKGLLMVSVDGRTKMVVEDVSNYTKFKKELTEETVVEQETLDLEVPFAIIHEVPTFSFCDSFKSQEERKQCLVDNISKHVNKKFNTDLAKKLGLSGRQRINVMFKIDKKGVVTGVKARAPHPALEEEAIRVINELPQFIPGKHKGKPVVVPYSLPILFQVHADTSVEKGENYNVGSVEEVKQIVKDHNTTKVQDKEVPFAVVDEVPMYESCVGLPDNEARKKCVSREVAIYVNKNFNVDLASKLGLLGRQRITVIFKIDKLGYVTNVKARASHPDIEKEAIRVIKGLPQFIPGKHKGKPVIVPYSLPITFQIAPDTNKDKKN
ncbi:M56 family metallopeptidase [Psychroserpens luteolus]|uniref:M56 family metallopeptidase n=1 Tax=Psychroserpens luteolus TaxID=2855840 RepID=UPI001E5BAAE8|nr:M56 family metallopeptidase [Psychroserpens luteolus]MCD2257856.1 M56 family metallopeptidase [Psychroserpens luteolus]